MPIKGPNFVSTVIECHTSKEQGPPPVVRKIMAPVRHPVMTALGLPPGGSKIRCDSGATLCYCYYVPDLRKGVSPRFMDVPLRERSVRPTPKEQPPRKLSGTRIARVMTLWRVALARPPTG